MRQLMQVKAGVSIPMVLRALTARHGGHQGRGRRILGHDIVAESVEAELLEEGGAHDAAFARACALQATGFGAHAEHVHE